MKLIVKPCKNRFLGIIISVFFSGFGMMIYVDFVRGLFLSIFEVSLIVLFGIFPGLIVGSIFATLWSSKILAEYEEIYKRAKAIQEIKITPPLAYL